MRKTCFDMIYELAKNDKRIVYIGSDVGAGTLQKMKEEMPDQFFMEGIQEQSIIGMATGLALSGKIVYVNTLACFLTRRCYEQIYLDVGLHNAKVRLLGNGGGLAYAALGPTHIACDDIALMRNIPNMTILVPADAEEMKRLIPQTVDYPHPMYIRFSAGNDPLVTDILVAPFEIGASYLYKAGDRGTVITTGITLELALRVHNINVIHCPTLPCLALPDFSPSLFTKKVITVEEHNKIGGLGDIVRDMGVPVTKIGIPDVYVDRYGTQESLMKYYGITTEAIENAIRS